MTELLQLFFIFFKIGLFTFGGGYAMIPLIKEEVISNGFLDEATLLKFIAISESTPGPFAVNIATFIGAEQSGFIGALFATLGVILPSFIIIIIIAALLSKFLQYKQVKYALSGIKAVVIGLILFTGIELLLKTVYPDWKNLAQFNLEIFDYKSLIVFTILSALFFGLPKIIKKKISPILLILVSAVIGMLIF